jgi:hypothetical protein
MGYKPAFPVRGDAFILQQNDLDKNLPVDKD